jgi:hypothetical protein
MIATNDGESMSSEFGQFYERPLAPWYSGDDAAVAQMYLSGTSPEMWGLTQFPPQPIDYGTRAGLQGASISPALRDSPRVMLANELQKRSKKKSKPEKREKDHR